MKIFLALLITLPLYSQVPAVPNSDFPTFRTNLNNSLAKAANITTNYSNPSWITSLAYAKITGVPTFVPTGGTAGQVLAKIDSTNYNTAWVTPSSGGGIIPSVTNMLSGNGSGNAADSGIAVADVAKLAGTQTFTGDKNFTGSLNFGGATHTITSKTGVVASLPATCTVGEEYFATNATAGQNKYYCTLTNTWTQQLYGGTSLVFSTSTLLSQVATPADEWLMQEGSGNTFADTSGTANTITAGGTVTWDSSGHGGCASPAVCAHFPGTYASTSANHTNFAPTRTSAFTISGWFEWDTIATTARPLWMQSGTSSAIMVLESLPTGGMQLYYLNTAGTGINLVFSFTPATGRQYHVVFTSDGNSSALGLHLFIDGRAILLGTIAGSTVTGTATMTSNFTLGSQGGAFFQGYITCVRLYNRELSLYEIQALYRAGPITGTLTTAVRTGKRLLASSFATLDADCNTGAKIGGGTPTDNTEVFNAVLATATQANPLWVDMDGCTSGGTHWLAYNGYTTITGTGWNTGFYVKSGTNGPAISNGYGLSPYAFATPTQKGPVNISNLMLNGNRGTYPNGNASWGGDARGGTSLTTALTWIPTMDLSNLNGVYLDHLYLYNSPTYFLMSSNNSNITVSNSKVEVVTQGATQNTDGLHFSGINHNIVVKNLWCKTSDDCVALNAPEGYSGTISGAFINDLYLSSTYSGVRVYACNGASCYTISGVNIDGVSGSVSSSGYQRAFVLAGETGSTSKVTDSITDVSISNVSVTGAAFIEVGDPIGVLNINNYNILQPNVVKPLVSWHNGTGNISSLNINNSQIYRISGSSLATLMTVASPNTVKRVTVNNFAVADQNGFSGSAINLISVPSGGAIGTLVYMNPNPTNITAVLTSGSDARVTNIIAPIGISGATPTVATCGTIGTGSTNSAGFITSATTGSCVSVLTFKAATATTGWSCAINNSTTPANIIQQTGSSTTTATFTGTTVSGDVLPYTCSPY